jgi:hypothetical protein
MPRESQAPATQMRSGVGNQVRVVKQGPETLFLNQANSRDRKPCGLPFTRGKPQLAGRSVDGCGAVFRGS